MPLTKREAFKTAFLLRCADAGMTQEETHELVKEARGRLALEKQATGPWPTVVENIPGARTFSDVISKSIVPLISSLAQAGGLAAVGLPLAVGGAGGLLASKLHGINDRNIEEIRLEEKKDALRRAARRARVQTASRRRRAKKRPSRPML